MPDIDYAALADQARQASPAIDYAALAEQARKADVKPAPGVIGTVMNAAPSVGGAIGGIVGGVPGAVMGGEAGSGFKSLYNNAAEIGPAISDVAHNLVSQPGATLKGFVQGATHGAENAGTEGAVQGAFQGVGEGVAKAASPMAKWLMSRATSRVSAQLAREFPELNDTLLSNALTVSKGGYEKARALLSAAKAPATAALAGADAAGSTVPLQLTPEIADSLKTALLEKAVKSGAAPVTPGAPIAVASQRLNPATQALFGQIDKTAEAGGVLDALPSHADLLKSQLQKQSKQLYANRYAPNGSKAVGMGSTELAEFASRLNDAVDGLAPGYKGANAAAQPLIGAVRGLKQAIRPNGNLYQAMVRPAVGGLIGEEAGRRNGVNPYIAGVAGAAMTSPQGMSREAIMLASPTTQTLLRQGVPNALRAAILGQQSDSQR